MILYNSIYSDVNSETHLINGTNNGSSCIKNFVKTIFSSLMIALFIFTGIALYYNIMYDSKSNYKTLIITCIILETLIIICLTIWIVWPFKNEKIKNYILYILSLLFIPIYGISFNIVLCDCDDKSRIKDKTFVFTWIIISTLGLCVCIAHNIYSFVREIVKNKYTIRNTRSSYSSLSEITDKHPFENTLETAV
jgi:cytochrome bd-type quinol oxidase subunit 2